MKYKIVKYILTYSFRKCSIASRVYSSYKFQWCSWILVCGLGWGYAVQDSQANDARTMWMPQRSSAMSTLPDCNLFPLAYYWNVKLKWGEIWRAIEFISHHKIYWDRQSWCSTWQHLTDLPTGRGRVFAAILNRWSCSMSYTWHFKTVSLTSLNLHTLPSVQ